MKLLRLLALALAALPAATRADPLAVPPLGAPASRPAARLVFAQSWLREPEAAFRPAEVVLGWTPAALHVRARLADDEILSAASADNQRLWQLGDVFEMFILVEGREDYLELHVSPNNKRMHQRFPRAPSAPLADASARPTTFAERLVHPVGFESEVTRVPDGWTVAATIPADALGLDSLRAGLRLRAAFARYDVASDRAEVLSSTAPHPEPAFHRPHEWTALRLATAHAGLAVRPRSR